ncbi:probable peroxisomal acyl-coenzyme A oxidase 1 [Condylostylus longicornis]|uniref:probable peroxisomal acyl-coenzyme A oxidase 1 n=1 Tax=Condylostylus longicornis TaxID=2530218 RepID=UPI00244E3553|nr:probable peroxisomal acyl-coenzyme A oxidase 1 [Condylostylus longicornis]
MPENKSKINPDLLRERLKCDFNIEELAAWWNGGYKKLEEKRLRENFFLSDFELQDDVPVSYMSHKELYEHSVKKSLKMVTKLKELQSKYNDGIDSYMALLGGLLGSGLLKQGNPLSVHYVMFLPTIMGQGTFEQQSKWLTRAWNCSIIGTYAQTELGHGTFIRGLETRADYDPKTKEFVLNSPTLTSYKWWPGGLGHTANYAIVVAQLYTKGKCHGIQPFIVQLRDEETHMPMPGIKIGEIGAKLGMNGVNNGYLGFENVRIPRTNMLMKNAQVLEDGTFVEPSTSVLTYGTMMFVRVVIVRDTASNLAKCSTIATRYSAIRRQSPINPNKPEPQVIDHFTQQLKLFPYIAKTIAFKLSADYIWNMYNNVSAELEKGNLERLPELHALSCCLKAVCTSDASTGVEVLRMACGGHGYLNCSNFPIIYGNTTAACTYEGENTVMLLQTSRFLMKAWEQALKQVKLTPTVAYLADAIKLKKFATWDGTVPSIVEAFRYVAANKIRVAYEHLEARKATGLSHEEASNMTGIELTQAADLHCRAFILSSAWSEIQEAVKNVSPALGKVLIQLMELYAVDSCFNRLGDLLRFIDIKEDDLQNLQKKLEDLLHKIRPNAVGIVDGFDLPDIVLGSALGCYDGNVYDRIFEEAQKSPLNQEPVNKSFHLYLKPFMKSNL